jgi:hypothetical protein
LQGVQRFGALGLLGGEAVRGGRLIGGVFVLKLVKRLVGRGLFLVQRGLRRFQLPAYVGQIRIRNGKLIRHGGNLLFVIGDFHFQLVVESVGHVPAHEAEDGQHERGGQRNAQQDDDRAILIGRGGFLFGHVYLLQFLVF